MCVVLRTRFKDTFLILQDNNAGHFLKLIFRLNLLVSSSRLLPGIEPVTPSLLREVTNSLS